MSAVTIPRPHADAGVWEALRGPRLEGVANASQDRVDFLVASAWSASLRLNFFGWLMRGTALLVALVVACTAPAWPLLLLLPAAVGWGMAGVELFRPDIINAGSSHEGLLGALATHMETSRRYASATIPGLLENAGSLGVLALFAGPVSLHLDGLWTAIGLLATAAYCAVCAAQVVTDAGYYNEDPHSRPPAFVLWFRWIVAPIYAVVGATAVAVADAAAGWVVAAMTMVFLGVIVVGLISDSIQQAAVNTHLMATQDKATELAALLGEEIHRTTTYLAEQGHSASTESAALAFALCHAEVDAIRERASTHQLHRPTSVGHILELLDRKEATRVDAEADSPETVLCHAGSTLLRHLALDLVTNSRTAGATHIRTRVTLEPLRHPFVMVTVTVTDDGPGFNGDQHMNDLRPGSSRAALRDICRMRRGTLSYARDANQTTATATFRTDIFVR